MNFKKEDGIAFSVEKIFIPSLKEKLNIWIYTENEQLNDFSPKQKRAFEEFLSSENILEQISPKLKKCYQTMCKKSEIVKSENDSFSLDYEALAVPSQMEISKNIIFLLANTNWQKVDSEYFMELELYFEDNKLLKISELNGSYIFPF